MARAQKNSPGIHQLLGLGGAATAKEVKASYLKEIKKLHPDKNPKATKGDKERLVLLIEAYAAFTKSKPRAGSSENVRPRKPPGYTETPWNAADEKALERMMNELYQTQPSMENLARDMLVRATNASYRHGVVVKGLEAFFLRYPEKEARFDLEFLVALARQEHFSTAKLDLAERYFNAHRAALPARDVAVVFDAFLQPLDRELNITRRRAEGVRMLFEAAPHLRDAIIANALEAYVMREDRLENPHSFAATYPYNFNTALRVHGEALKELLTHFKDSVTEKHVTALQNEKYGDNDARIRDVLAHVNEVTGGKFASAIRPEFSPRGDKESHFQKG